MLLCHYAFMRTTIDLPDALFRRIKALAAMEGSSLKALIVRALERETNATGPWPRRGNDRVRLPHIRLKRGRKLDLTGFDFDGLLG
jgi:hypothetical protein